MSERGRHPGFEQRILAPLRKLARTVKRYVLLEGFCALVVVAVAVAAVQLGLDRLLHLGLGPRIALLAIALGILAHQFYIRVLRPGMMRIGVDDVAALLERRNPALRDQLISAVAFSAAPSINPHRDSPELVSALIDRTSSLFSRVSTDVFKQRRHHGFLAAGLAAVAVAAGATLAAPDLVSTYLLRDVMLQDVPWPSRLHITLEGFDEKGVLRWPLGDELTLVATAHGDEARDVPSGLTAEFRGADGATAARPMDLRGTNQFILDYGPLAQGLAVRLQIHRFGADERTAWYEIQAIERPSVREVAITVTPPPYTEQEAFTLPSGQSNADVLRGSQVRIDAILSKPVKRAMLKLGGIEAAPVRLESATRVVADFVPVRTGSYHFDLTDVEGLSDVRPITYALRLMEDTPPKARLMLPGVGDMVVPNAVIDLAVESEDNLGLQSVELIRTVRREAGADGTEGAGETSPEPLPGFEKRQTRYGVNHSWALQPLGLTPGNMLTLQVRARDFQPSATTQAVAEPVEAAGDTRAPGVAAAAGVGESVAYTLRVVTREELLAELGRREQEWRREFEQIIKSQEQLNTRIMDLRDTAARGGESEDLAVRYGQEGRTQRQQIGRLKTIRVQFEQIVAELKTNQLDTPPVRRRLSEGVIAPLARLIGTDVVEAADMVDRLRQRFDMALADELERRQAQIVQTMYAVLANMLKWEGYNEAVALLQDIVRLQGDVNRQTQARLEREIERLFGSEPTTKPETRP